MKENVTVLCVPDFHSLLPATERLNFQAALDHYNSSSIGGKHGVCYNVDFCLLMYIGIPYHSMKTLNMVCTEPCQICFDLQIRKIKEKTTTFLHCQ